MCGTGLCDKEGAELATHAWVVEVLVVLEIASACDAVGEIHTRVDGEGEIFLFCPFSNGERGIVIVTGTVRGKSPEGGVDTDDNKGRIFGIEV